MEEGFCLLEDYEKWIALYWTFPVPWAGHTKLDEDAASAAKQSMTIQFQRNLVRQKISVARTKLIDEVSYMELHTFRPGKEIADVLAKIANRCRTDGAGFVYVRFGGPARIRYHSELEHLVETSFIKNGIPCVNIPVDPPDTLPNIEDKGLNSREPKMISPGLIEPYAHFRAWKAADKARKNDRERQVSQIIDFVTILRSNGQTFAEIKTHLNDNNILSTTGKRWTTEGLGKFFKRNGGV